MSNERLRLYSEELSDKQEYLRLFRMIVRAYIKWAIAVGRYATELGAAESYAASKGWNLPIVPPQPGYYDISDPDSGFCTFVRQAAAADFLSGQEAWLEPANWRKA